MNYTRYTIVFSSIGLAAFNVAYAVSKPTPGNIGLAVFVVLIAVYVIFSDVAKSKKEE